MVVRHLPGGDLVLGRNEDNLKDEKGKSKKPVRGYTTSRMYLYKGVAYNLTKLCQVTGSNYGKIYQQLRQSRPPREVLDKNGLANVKPLF